MPENHREPATGFLFRKTSAEPVQPTAFQAVVYEPNWMEKPKLLANENDLAFGNCHAARVLDGDGKLINARDVLDQVDPQTAVTGLVGPSNACRDRRFGAADRPNLEAFPPPFENGRKI